MSWVPVMKVGDIEVGKVAVVEVDGLRLAICHTEDGHYAIDDECTHDGGPLDQGELLGDRIECPRHGAQFDVKTGKVLALPAVRPVKAYPTRVTDGHVEVEVP